MKETFRKCISCSQIKKRDELIKITKEKSSGKIFINPDSKIFGRSAYLCYNETCIKESLKKNKLEKSLRTSVQEDLKEQLKAFHKE